MLCLAGDYAAALPMIEANLATDGVLSTDRVVTAYAECALRSGDLAAAQRVIGHAPHYEREYWDARLQVNRGQLPEALSSLERHSRGLDAAVLKLWLLAKLGKLEAYESRHRFDRVEPAALAWAIDQVAGYQYFAEPIDEARLEELIEMVGPSNNPRLRTLAGRLMVLRATYLVQRGDQQSRAWLSRALPLLGKTERYRATFLEALRSPLQDGWTTADELRARLEAAFSEAIRGVRASNRELEWRGNQANRVRYELGMDAAPLQDEAPPLTANEEKMVDHVLGDSPLALFNQSPAAVLLETARHLDHSRAEDSLTAAVTRLQRWPFQGFLALQVSIAAARQLELDAAPFVEQLARLRALAERPGNTVIMGAFDRLWL
ncbi:MAG: hypothetical protein AB7O24_30615 [Kofleriaceae bacterium]